MERLNEIAVPTELSRFTSEAESIEITTWLHTTRRSLSIEEPLVSGRTGASVLRAVLHADGAPDQKVILKLIPADEDLQEPSRHADATKVLSTGFAQQHLVELVDSFTLASGTTIMVQGLAGGSVEKYASLAALSGTSDFRRAAGETLSALSAETSRAFDAVRISLANLLGQQLRAKLTPGGSLHTWIVNEFGPEVMSAGYLKFQDDPSGTGWVNPLGFADLECPSGSKELRVLSGPTHGDLHADNVIVRLGRNPKFEDFRLIDLSYFERSFSLAVDPITLVLAEVHARLAHFSFGDKRILIDQFAKEEGGKARPPEVEDLLQVERGAYELGLERAKAAGFADEWAVQWDVAVCAGSLVWVSRPHTAFEDRVWFLELAAQTASRLANKVGLAAAAANAVLIGEPFDARRQHALSLVDRIVSENEHFDGSSTSVAIIPSTTTLSLAAQASIASAGWNVVFGYDPRADAGGAPSVAMENGAAVRVLRPSQDLDYSRAATVWIAVDGLEGTGYQEGKSLIEWRLENLNSLSRMIQELTKSSTGPVVVTTFGALDKKSQLILDKLLDHAGPLARLVAVHSNERSGIEDYDPLDLIGDTEIVAASIPPRLIGGTAKTNRVFVPAGPGMPPIELELQDQLWFGQAGGEVVHSGVALESRAVEGVAADFYHGRKISWLEVESLVDIPRREVFAALRNDVDAVLDERGTRRLRFRHTAGAGGTTLARRLAWVFHERYPTLIYSTLLAVDDVISRFERLSFLTGSRVLIILDGVPESLSNRLFERLQADSASAVLVLFERHIGGPDSADLGPLSTEEIELFKRIFTSLSPRRHNELQKLAIGRSEAQIPFLYALTAFQEDFQGVEDYVRRSLDGADEATKTVLASLAVAHLYAGETVAANVFAKLIGLPRNATVRLGASIQKRASGVVLEESPGQWRTLHTVIANELIKQLFIPQGASAASGSSLSAWAQEFIEMMSNAYPDPLPESAHQLLLKLFVLRENRDESAYGTRQRFSEFISDLPLNARFEVMRTLAETFSQDSHFWAHYARLLAYEGGDFDEAYKKVDTALAMSREDPTIWHIRGVIGRKKVIDLISSDRVGIEDVFELEAAVREASSTTIGDLLSAADLNDDSRYPQIDMVFLAIAVIEWAKRFKSFASHQALLSAVDGAFYAELLDTAEDALDELDSLQPEDPGYQIAEDAGIKLHAIYDDYHSLIEGWRGKIGLPGVENRVIRSRLARAYVQRAGSYVQLDFSTTAEIASLMEQNLREWPGDVRSIREWLRTARKTGGHLDKAGEFVSYWIDNDATRDARFYDYVVSALLVLQGRSSARPDFERKLDLSKSRSQSYSRRRVIYEWLGSGVELAALVHHSEVADWDRRSERSPEPPNLRRVRGVIDSIKDAKSGYLLIEGGLRVFFSPGGRFVRGRNEGDKITALIGFAYDGPEGWRVRPQ